MTRTNKQHTKHKTHEIIQSVSRVQVSLKRYMNFATAEIIQPLELIRKSPNKSPWNQWHLQ